MSVYRRIALVAMTWIGIAVASIIYYFVFVGELLVLATETHSGPFSEPVAWLEVVVPLALVTIGVGVTIWAISAGAQEERSRKVRGRY